MNYKELKDEHLISKILDDNCSDSLVELTNRHHGLVVQIMRRFAGAAQCSGVAMQDFLDESNYIVFDAAKQYKAEKNIKFSTWLGNSVRYYCLNQLKKQKKYYSPDQTELTSWIADHAKNEKDGEKIELEENLEYIIDILSQIKDKRIEKIVRMRYLSGKPKKESFSVIGKELGMSPQGVIDLHDSFITFVGEKMRSDANIDKI